MPRLPLLARLTLGTLVLVSCSDGITPTQPEAGGDGQPSSAAVALASNSWTARTPLPIPRLEYTLAAAPNSAGQWIAYVFGGVDGDGFSALSIYAYNVTTDSWGGAGSFRPSNTNGAGKIGNRFYLTGGRNG